MEMSERVPELGLVSTRIVSVRNPVIIFASSPVRWSDPRMSQLVPDVLALSDSQGCLSS